MKQIRKNRKIKKRQALIMMLAVCMLASNLAGVTVWAKETGSYTKNENVYAKIGADGTVGEIYVVNAFETEKSTKISDYGNYGKIENLTDLTELKQEDGAVSFHAEEGKFYYQGTITEGELPWKIGIFYILDGQSISPEELGGASGALKIRIKIEQNKSINPVFYKNYVMQVSLTLDGEKCSNIEAEGGTLADAGSNVNIAYNVMPGEGADLTVLADVTDFKMQGMSIAAVPYSMNVDMGNLGTDEITGQMQELTDAAKELQDGTSQLDQGVSALNKGSSELKKGAQSVGDGLTELKNNAASITEGSAKIKEALININIGLGAVDFSSMDQLGELPKSLDTLSASLKKVREGLIELQKGFSQSKDALEGAIVSYQGGELTEEEISALSIAAGGDETASAALQKLLGAYQAVSTIQGTYAQVKPAFDAVNQALDGSSDQSVVSGIGQICGGLDQMSQTLSGQLSAVNVTASMNQLKDGIRTLAANYITFHDGLTSYVDGVSALSDGYGEFYKGMDTYLSGVGELSGGSGELADGMQKFADGVSGIPDQIQSTVDEMAEKYSSSDFDAVSFVDSRNSNINTVQFVISTAEIKKPEAKADETVVEEKKVFWDRLLDLFR